MDVINQHNYWSNPHLIKGEDAEYWLGLITKIGYRQTGSLILLLELVKWGYSNGKSDEDVMKDVKGMLKDDAFDELIMNYRRHLQSRVPDIPNADKRPQLEERSEMISVMAENLTKEWSGKINGLVEILDDTADKLKARGLQTWWK